MKQLALLLSLILILTSCGVSITELEPVKPDPNLPTGEVKVHFIDVGQGDAVLIQGTGGQNVLYDGGRRNADALEYLQRIGITKLDIVIASHPDADHVGGLDKVIEFYKPRFYMDNGVIATTQVYKDVLEAVSTAGTSLLDSTRRTISLGEATLEIIPPPNDPDFNRNNNSIGLILDFGDFETALTGDAEEEEFAWWLSNTPEYLREVEIYKSAHHGSSNGDTAEGIAVLSPEVVVIGVGEGNNFGHPTNQALELYESVNATVLRTDEKGDVVITGISDGSYSIATSK